MRIAPFLFGLALWGSAAAVACDGAATPAERAACADPELSTLREHLDRYYRGALHALGDAGGRCLATDQMRWLGRRDACADRACLKSAYLDRLAELHPLQPGANAITAFELPARPALVWVIPPAADPVAAPERPRAPPLEVEGRLVDETADGDGFALRAADGRSYLVEMSMLLEGDTAARLAGLAADGAARYRVRGHAAEGDGGVYFEPGRCRFLQRLPAEPSS